MDSVVPKHGASARAEHAAASFDASPARDGPAGAAGPDFVRAAGVRVEGRGRPLLLVNGLLHGHELWEPLVRHFAADRRTIRFDFPHQNGSALTGRYNSFERYCDFVAEMIGALGLDPAETEAFGFSIGGDVLRSLAVDRGMRFRHVVIAAGAPPGIERFWREFFGAALATLRHGQFEAFTRLVAFQFYSPLFIQKHPGLLNVMQLKCAQRFPDLRRLEELLDMPLTRRFPDPERDGALRGAATLIHCRYDPLAPIELAREYASRVQLPSYEIATGHTLLAEAPDEVARLVMDILRAA